MSVSGWVQEKARLLAGVKALEKEAVVITQKGAREAMRSMMSATPVWSGETVRNYVWAKGKRPSGGTKEPIGTGDPGPTNSMSLGAEPRRGANEGAAKQEMEAAISGDKLVSLFATNTIAASKWDLVDNGSIPGGPGQRRRGPGGVSKLAEQTLRATGYWK